MAAVYYIPKYLKNKHQLHGFSKQAVRLFRASKIGGIQPIQVEFSIFRMNSAYFGLQKQAEFGLFRRNSVSRRRSCLIYNVTTESPNFSIGPVELQQNALLEARLETDLALANPEVMSHNEGTTRKTLFIQGLTEFRYRVLIESNRNCLSTLE